jgi:hypothetical protein
MSTLALTASLLGLTACPGSLSFDYGGMAGQTGNNDSGVITSCANATTLLQTTCAVCHSSAAPPTYASLDLMSPNPETRLVGVAASSSGMCLGKGNLLDKGTVPATGILIDKITMHQTCGGVMPAIGSLQPNDITCLQQWASGLVASVGP